VWPIEYARRVLYASRVVSVLSLCWFATDAWGTNIVINGGFDGTTFTETFGTVTDVLPFGWGDTPPGPANSSNINVVSAANFPGFPDPDGGGFYVAFMSPATDGTQDCLYQDLDTVPGEKYTLTFKAAITSASPYLQLLPDWDAFGSDRTFISVPRFNSATAATSSSAPLTFQTFTFTNLTASLTKTRLYFHGVDSKGAILLDSVMVTPQSDVPAGDAPLPLWSLVALGAGLIGVTSRRLGANTHAAIAKRGTP
jgi:hypothetical protein